jgi:hypothetical protein
MDKVHKPSDSEYQYTYSCMYILYVERLCSLVVRVPGYKSRDPGSIPDATRFSEK